MEPRIQYAKTSDGVNVAFWTTGAGSPLVFMHAFPWTHVQLECHQPSFSLWYEAYVQRWKLVRFDPRGSGLSDRNVGKYSLDCLLLDLDAVVERLRLDEFVLVGVGSSGLVAIAYALRHPDQATHLVLWDAFPNGRRFLEMPPVRAFVGLAENDWNLFTETAARAITVGWSAGDVAKEFAEFLSQCADRQHTVSYYSDAVATTDLTDRLGDLVQPTLVIQHRTTPLPDMETARMLASQIPDARMVVLEGNWLDAGQDIQTVMSALDELVGRNDAADTTPWGPARQSVLVLPSGMTAILFADIVDSTALTERLGDDAFRARARDLDAALRTVIRERAGTPIEGKLLGDGVLAVFTSAREAIEGALACARAGDDGGLPLHLGLHAGDVLREKDPDGRDNVYGGAVNIASRISGLSAPGEVLVSETVRSLARTSAGVRFEDRGEQALKGVGEAVRVWAVKEGKTS